MLWPPMRVTLVAPLVAPLRPAQVGGAQVVLSSLAGALAAAGDEVELAAAPGSAIPPGVARRRVDGGPYPEALVKPTPPPGATADHWPAAQASAYLHLAAALRGATPRPDVVHSHALDWPAFYALAAGGMPTLHTLHLGPLDPAAAAAAHAAAACRPRPRFVAVSQSCKAQWRGIVPVDAVIPNGADPNAFPFGADPQPDLAIVAGRISPEKGTHLAIQAARSAGLSVVIAGAVYDPAYFDEQVRPLLGAGVRHLGHVAHPRLATLYGRAAVAVVASLWEEPFGMVALEANLAGTPVAGFARGALPEVVTAATGTLTGDTTVQALAEAIRDAATRDRAQVRRSAAARFPLTRMVQRYRTVYRATADAA